MTIDRRHAALAVLVAILLIVVVVIVRACGANDEPGQLAATGRGLPTYADARRTEFEQRAAAGLSHVLYAKSPGGAQATAARVARLRPQIERAAGRCSLDPDLLEALVFLESAGEPAARASDDLSSAVGLTQILAETGSGLLGMRVDTAASTRLTRAIGRARSEQTRERLRARRRRVDERFDPDKALAATCRYITFARGHLGGRTDLALASYHMGVGNLQRALGYYGAGDDIPYARLYFDSSPLRHARAWRFLNSLGDDSSTYLWRIFAARDILRLYRRDPDGLRRVERLQAGAPSRELVLHPPDRTPVFADADALKTSALVRLDDAVLSPTAGRLSTTLAAEPVGRRSLRPEAAALLRTLTLGVAAIAPGERPLTITAATRSRADEDGGKTGGEQSPTLHTTGWSFDLSRSYSSGAQAEALQFWLDRLNALDLIAWSRERNHIHVTVSSRAKEL